MQGLESKIGYNFRNKLLFQQAMTHSSYSNEQKINKVKNYERIEFLGDAVLELVSSEFFYHKYPNDTEGNLTKYRASAVCEQALAITARELDLGNYLILGKGEEAHGGRMRESIIADAVEALIGAIFLDSGMEAAKEFVLKFVLNDLEDKQLFYDAKSILLEKVQEHKLGELVYILIREYGPEHDKKFEMQAVLNGEVIGYGSGRSKKMAQQQAAYDALKKHGIKE